MSLLSSVAPNWVGLAGAAMLTVAGAALIAIRPADKAAQNEAAMKCYQALMIKGKDNTVSDDQLVAAIEDALQGAIHQVESLRNVAYNDVALEFNRPDVLITLSATEKALSIFA